MRSETGTRPRKLISDANVSSHRPICTIYADACIPLAAIRPQRTYPHMCIPYASPHPRRPALLTFGAGKINGVPCLPISWFGISVSIHCLSHHAVGLCTIRDAGFLFPGETEIGELGQGRSKHCKGLHVYLPSRRSFPPTRGRWGTHRGGKSADLPRPGGRGGAEGGPCV